MCVIVLPLDCRTISTPSKAWTFAPYTGAHRPGDAGIARDRKPSMYLGFDDGDNDDGVAVHGDNADVDVDGDDVGDDVGAGGADGTGDQFDGFADGVIDSQGATFGGFGGGGDASYEL